MGIWLLERKPKQLSGGQRPRIDIGRAIVREPRITSTSSCRTDAELRMQMRVEIVELHRRQHDDLRHPRPRRGDDHGREIVVLRNAYIVQVGSPLDLQHAGEAQPGSVLVGSIGVNLIE